MTEQLDRIMGKPIKYAKPHVAEARMEENAGRLDRDSITEGLPYLSLASRLRVLKKKCDADDETACDVYEITVNGDGGDRIGLRQMWENDENLEAKAVLEEIGEL